MPKNLSYEQAATLPEAYATSYLNLFWEGHLNKENTAFIPAGASGLASVAIPMAKAFGARVITSVLSDEIAKKIAPLGADVVINSANQDVSEFLNQEELNGTPVNMSMDCLCVTQWDGSIVLTKLTYDGIIIAGDYYAKTST